MFSSVDAFLLPLIEHVSFDVVVPSLSRNYWNVSLHWFGFIHTHFNDQLGQAFAELTLFVRQILFVLDLVDFAVMQAPAYFALKVNLAYKTSESHDRIRLARLS